MKKIVLYTFFSIFLILGVYTTIKVAKKHNDNLYIVSEKRIIEAAQRCWNEKKCNDEKVLLKELYDLKYLEKEANPVTKEYYNDGSYVEKKEDKYEFIIIV